MATPVPCNLDSERGATEVFIKRMAVMFTVLCLQGHLNSLRGVVGSIQLRWSICMFFFNPVYPIFRLLFDIGWAFRKAWDDAHDHSRYRPIGVNHGQQSSSYYVDAAIGMHASYDEMDYFPTAGPKPVPTSMTILRIPQWATSMKREAQGSKRLGRLIVLIAVGIQCTATVLLGIRREMKRAASPFDRLYFLFALSGLALLAQTITAQTYSRSYTVTKLGSDGKPTVNGVEVYGWSVFVEILHYIGSLCAVLYFVHDELFFICQILVAFLWVTPMVWPWSTFIGPEVTRYATSWKETMDELLLLIVIGCLTPVVFGACSIGLFIFMSYNPISDQFRLVGWPDQSCSFLWKDPLADMLWAF